jgi:hypothetical protein
LVRRNAGSRGAAKRVSSVLRGGLSILRGGFSSVLREGLSILRGGLSVFERFSVMRADSHFCE